MSNLISKKILSEIYGTLENLEESCSYSNSCWSEINNHKWNQKQNPYLPYVGKEYKEILFSGINLNGAFDSINAISSLVEQAIENYLKCKKFLIFADNGYRGSPFYYYVPLLSYLYYSYFYENHKYDYENQINYGQIIRGFEYCALTNIIKCSTNSPDRRSTPSKNMYKNCGKNFCLELEHIPHKVLVIFTYFGKPKLVNEYFSNYEIVTKCERFRIQKCEDKFILELEHPLSTAVKRHEKFKNYQKAICNLVDLIKKHNKSLNPTA